MKLVKLLRITNTQTRMKTLNKEHWAGLLEIGINPSGSEFSLQIIHAKSCTSCVNLCTNSHKMSVVSWCWM